MKIYLGSDQSGVDYRDSVYEYLLSLNHEVEKIDDFNKYPDYPDIAKEVCNNVLKEAQSKGILICGTGMGMCLAANKMKGIRATLCNNIYTAVKSRSSNDANILTLGALTTDIEMVKSIVKTWTKNYIINPSSVIKVEKILRIENEET
jgi:ribose 5-phosphate isomerase B